MYNSLHSIHIKLYLLYIALPTNNVEYNLHSAMCYDSRVIICGNVIDNTLHYSI